MFWKIAPLLPLYSLSPLKDIAMSKIPQHGQKVKNIAANDFFLKSDLFFCSFICSYAGLTYLPKLGGICLKNGFLNLG
tara:strand:- start:606 stop:839 length:234 start_codon:yes stop_codon:yes gene_type:complete